MKFILLSSLVASLAFGASCPTTTAVATVDLNKYAGVWYEVASANLGVTSGCSCTHYDYLMTSSSTFTDRFRCNQNGKVDSLDFTAIGKVADLTKPGIQYESPVVSWAPSAPYVILELGSNYEYAVVYSCVNTYVAAPLQYTYRDGLATLDMTGIKSRLTAQGVDVSQIVTVPQNNCDCKVTTYSSACMWFYSSFSCNNGDPAYVSSSVCGFGKMQYTCQHNTCNSQGSDYLANVGKVSANQDSNTGEVVTAENNNDSVIPMVLICVAIVAAFAGVIVVVNVVLRRLRRSTNPPQVTKVETIL